MRDEFLILGAAQGGPLALTSIDGCNDCLTFRFESGRQDIMYRASQVRVNGRLVMESSVLRNDGAAGARASGPERRPDTATSQTASALSEWPLQSGKTPEMKQRGGEVLLNINLKKVPSYGDGFENMYEITAVISSAGCMDGQRATAETPTAKYRNPQELASAYEVLSRVSNEGPVPGKQGSAMDQCPVPGTQGLAMDQCPVPGTQGSAMDQCPAPGKQSSAIGQCPAPEKRDSAMDQCPAPGTWGSASNQGPASGTLSCVYDLARKCVSCLSLNGKMLSQQLTAAWNEGSAARREQTPLEQLMSELNALPGLDEVKDEIRSSINMNRLQKIRRERGFSAIDMSLHMVFTGNPGTGKTTLARLLAKIYKEAGILSRGQFVEADRSTLVSHYIGGTAAKVGRVVDSAIGGILFIDEAYSLADGQDGKDYGREAITTLLKRMEDNRDNLIVIVAGYPEKMERFLDSNPGFRSRFNRFIAFRDYSAEELTDIFFYECRKYGLVSEKGMDRLLTTYFRKLIMEKDPYFANGRTVRNLFEQTLVNQANRFEGRTDLTDQELMLLKTEDLPGKVLTGGRHRSGAA